MNPPSNMLSFDLEYWHNSEFVSDKYKSDKEGSKESEELVTSPVNQILALLNKHNTKATFFTVAQLAKKHPDLIRKIQKAGHEIASHSYSHKRVDEMTREEFEQDIKKSKVIIRKIIKQNPKGFRAPSWSINNNNAWAIDILEKQGFVYDSSLFSPNIGFYGINSPQTKPYPPSKSDLTKEDSSRKIIEVPVIPFKILNLKIPFSGGVYFRLLNINLINFFTKSLNKKGIKVLFYFHPWEFSEKIPKVKTSIMGKIITYYNTKNNLKKLDNLLKNNKFTSIQEALCQKC